MLPPSSFYFQLKLFSLFFLQFLLGKKLVLYMVRVHQLVKVLNKTQCDEKQEVNK